MLGLYIALWQGSLFRPAVGISLVHKKDVKKETIDNTVIILRTLYGVLFKERDRANIVMFAFYHFLTLPVQTLSPNDISL